MVEPTFGPVPTRRNATWMQVAIKQYKILERKVISRVLETYRYKSWHKNEDSTEYLNLVSKTLQCLFSIVSKKAVGEQVQI